MAAEKRISLEMTVIVTVIVDTKAVHLQISQSTQSNHDYSDVA
jgi:hypothetical protein